MATIYQHGKKMKEIMEELELIERDIFLNLIVTSEEVVLVDDQMVAVAEDLKARKVKTMALTAGLTGSFDNISSMEEWRCHRLKTIRF